MEDENPSYSAEMDEDAYRKIEEGKALEEESEEVAKQLFKTRKKLTETQEESEQVAKQLLETEDRLKNEQQFYEEELKAEKSRKRRKWVTVGIAIGTAGALIGSYIWNSFSKKPEDGGGDGGFPHNAVNSYEFHDAQTFNDVYGHLPTGVQKNLTFDHSMVDGNVTNGELHNATLYKLSDGSGKIWYTSEAGLKWYQDLTPGDLQAIVDAIQGGEFRKSKYYDLSLTAESAFGDYHE